MISIHGKMLVKSLRDAILETYGLRLKVHQGFSMGQTAEDSATVASARSDKAQDFNGSIELQGSMTVAQAEESIKSSLGFAIQILDSTGANATNDSLLTTLGFRLETTAVAAAVKDSIVCSLARANDKDITRAADALQSANAKRIHAFLATSPLHMAVKLRMSPEEVLEQAKRSIRFARNLASDIEFSAEDGYRSEMDFLCRVVEAVINEGASTINIPDTVGYATPELYGEFIKTLRTRVPNSDKAVWSVHCHNDLGMAVANSLAGVKIGGAHQIGGGAGKAQTGARSGRCVPQPAFALQ